MKANQEIFKDVLMVNIQDTANISLTRIGRLGALFHDKKIFISLTLFERPAQYGPVTKPPVENNLLGAYESLKKAIINNSFKITLVLGNVQVFNYFQLLFCKYILFLSSLLLLLQSKILLLILIRIMDVTFLCHIVRMNFSD